MRSAIIGGTGVYGVAGACFRPDVIETRYGPAQVALGEGEWEDLVFLARHGAGHGTPPHRINYRANMLALKQLGVDRVLATAAVGGYHDGVPPGALVLLSDFIDFTWGRSSTYFEGGESGVVHIDMTQPYCPALRTALLGTAAARGLTLVPEGCYVCVEGPRFETPAEVRALARLGADVAGMTGVPEVTLARELGLHYAAVATVVNWGVGVRAEPLDAAQFDAYMAAGRQQLLPLFVDVLRAPLPTGCTCPTARMVIHPPADDLLL